MGGRVLFALSIAAFPEELPRDVLAAVFEGAAAKVREAGGTLAGGHTIRDPEPKYGLAVDRRGASGPAAAEGRRAAGRRAAPDEAARHRAPRQRPPPGPDRPRRSRRRDRRDAAPEPGRLRGPRRARHPRRDGRHRASACSATGWRWPAVGHAVRVRGGALPALPGALDLAAAGVETGGAAHNRRFVAALAIELGRRPELVSRSPTIRRRRAACSPPLPVDRSLTAVESALDRAGIDSVTHRHGEPWDRPGVSLA